MDDYPTPPSAKRQIFNLLAVLGSGFIAAFLVLFYLLYTYGPTGQYSAGNILIDPQLSGHLTYYDAALGKGNEGKFSLKGIYFHYFDKTKGALEQKEVSQEEYAELYTLLQKDVSILYPDEKLIASFYQPELSRLEMIATPILTGSGRPQQQTLLSIVFNPDTNHYRVTLRTASGQEEYVYFEHTAIYEQVLKILKIES